jgi:IclR family acetate operon transcriptional repressor
MERLSGTVIKAGAVLDAVLHDTSEGGIGLKELAASRYGRSTTHRLLQTLVHIGLISQTSNARYTIGPVMLQYAMVVGQSAPWIPRARGVLERLAIRTDETITLSLLLPAMQRVFVYQVESRQPVRWVATIGVRAPLYVGASGRAILAALPTDVLTAYLRDLRSHPQGEERPPEKDLFARVVEARKLGYATSVHEFSPDGAATAAAIVPDPHSVVGAVSIAIPVSRTNAELMTEHGALAQAAAREIEELIRGAA